MVVSMVQTKQSSKRWYKTNFYENKNDKIWFWVF